MQIINQYTGQPVSGRTAELLRELEQLKASGYKGKPLTEAQKAKLMERTPVQEADAERAALNTHVSGFGRRR